MPQLLSVWNALDTRRRVIVIGATVAMFAAVLALSRMASQPHMALLYAGLEPSAAGEVVEALEARGAVYDVRGGAIFVESSARDGLRMTLASEGLPANGAQGYELLDNLSGFGTTSQMFDAAYWRAKEGELSRTIVSSPQIKTARVHISNPSSNPFQRNLRPSASVAVTTNGSPLSNAHANALKFLVASAVAGLSAENVSVMDADSGIMLSGDNPATAPTEGRAAELRQNIHRLLEARVGPGRAVVEVSVETVTEREAIVERRFDPEGRVAISSETEERSTASSGSQAGAVTVASNLPTGETGNESNSRSENSETRERVNYEVSETTREILRIPGAVKRVSVAVLVDGLTETDPATGDEVWQPRPEQELEALRELVASAVGFDEARGDTITIKSMQLEPAELPGSADAPGWLDRVHIDAMALVQLGILALVALVLGLFVVRPILKPRLMPAELPAPERAALPAVLATDGDQPLTGVIEDGALPDTELALVSAHGGKEPVPGDPVARLRHLIDDRRDETVEILRSWMEEPAEREEQA